MMTDTGNLPAWPGADSVYRKLGYVSAAISSQSYHSQRAAWLRRGKGRFNFIVSPASEEIIDALNEGNEEKCKGLLGLAWVKNVLASMPPGSE